MGIWDEELVVQSAKAVTVLTVGMVVKLMGAGMVVTIGAITMAEEMLGTAAAMTAVEVGSAATDASSQTTGVDTAGRIGEASTSVPVA
jgi:hypothetical protein